MAEIPIMPFTTKKVSIETLGEYLRDTRVSQGLDLERASQLTRVPVKHLQSLEQGDYEHLPADVYVKGFLKNIAQAYRISADLLVDQFRRERGLHQTVRKEDRENSGKIKRALPRITITPKTISLAAVVILAIVSVGYLLWQIRSVAAPPQMEILYPETNVSVTSHSILLRGRTEIGSRVYINNEEVLVDESGEFREVINLASGANRLIVAAENKFGKRTEKERVIVVNSARDSTSTAEDSVGSRAINIEVKIGPEDSWIKVASDGSAIFNDTVEAGTTLMFSADQELLLTTGNAGSTSVTYNEQELGVLGKMGEVISDIRFTK